MFPNKNHVVLIFETLILEKRIRIAVNPVLRSCVASACFDVSPAGLKRFAKNKSTSRIDLAVAAAMAIGAATLYEKVETQSYTANNGVVFL
jgi:phage terminase large subunit-like protein